MKELTKKIEALLFVSGEGMAISRISSALKISDKEALEAIEELKTHLADSHWLTLLQDGGKVSLVTSGEASRLVEDFAKEEFAGELTRAALETLAIVAYKGPLKRSEIDYIRGVNSSFMLRNLLMRGLVERKTDSKDSRSFIYRISDDFLKFLGITSLSDLPEYGNFAQKLDEFLKESAETKKEDNE